MRRCLVPTPTKRKTVMRGPARRQPVNLESLQMMVMSGVVRRADFNPPPAPRRRGILLPDAAQAANPQESVSEQGWLSRMILGPRPHAFTTNRPGGRG
jgi:hypothetical protein